MSLAQELLEGISSSRPLQAVWRASSIQDVIVFNVGPQKYEALFTKTRTGVYLDFHTAKGSMTTSDVKLKLSQVFEVYSAMAKITKMYLEKHHPKFLYAYTDEKKKAKIYQRMARVLKPELDRLGYEAVPERRGFKLRVAE